MILGIILLKRRHKDQELTSSTKEVAGEIFQRWLRSLRPTKSIPPIFDEPYEDLLKRPEWHAKVLRIKERDSYRCVYCGNVCSLEVHHKYYSRYPNGQKVAPWNYPDDALITLCDKCHKRVHETKVIKLYYRKYSDNYD